MLGAGTLDLYVLEYREASETVRSAGCCHTVCMHHLLNLACIVAVGLASTCPCTA